MNRRKSIIKEHSKSDRLDNDDISSFEKSVRQKIEERLQTNRNAVNEMKIDLYLLNNGIKTY